MVAVVLTPGAVEDIQALPAPIIARIHALVARLAHWPDVSGAKPLKGDLAGKYRLRTGDYRLQFRVEQTAAPDQPARTKKQGKRKAKKKKAVDYRVIVEKAGHRDGFYDE